MTPKKMKKYQAFGEDPPLGCIIFYVGWGSQLQKKTKRLSDDPRDATHFGHGNPLEQTKTGFFYHPSTEQRHPVGLKSRMSLQDGAPVRER